MGILCYAGSAIAADHVSYFYNGSLTSGEYRDATTSGCTAMTNSTASWTTGAGAYGKVVLISSGGSWLAADESTSGYASVSLSTYNANKADCRNTTPWQVTVHFDCYATSTDLSPCV